MNKYLKLLIDRKFRFSIFASRGIYNRLSDENFLKKAYKIKMGKSLNLNDPKTFNEKLQWLKLYDRNPLYTTLVDKYEVKKYIADKIGEEYIIPTLGVWDSFDDIDFDSLPNQFVLKCTHDSGGIVVCRSKSELDIDKARKKMSKNIKRNFFWYTREWPYKNIKPRIIAEKYMEDSQTEELRDYKFFCFNGEVKALFIASERQKKGEEVKFDFFDPDFNHLPIRQGHPNAKVSPEKPACFEEMKSLAQKLSKDIPHVRIDFYEANQQVYFGEMTFYHFSGTTPFQPEEWDYKFGDWITLNKQSR